VLFTGLVLSIVWHVQFSNNLTTVIDIPASRMLVQNTIGQKNSVVIVRYGQMPPTAKTYTLAMAACQWDWDSAILLLRQYK
jgi:hypothetical protein